MSRFESPPSSGLTDFRRWSERLNDFLIRTKSRLAHFAANDSATDDGIILWDPVGYPVVSKNNEWRQIVLADGYGEFEATTTQTAAAADTKYHISFDTVSASGGLSINSTDDTKIEFSEAGVYRINGHVQLVANSASDKTFYGFFEKNGSAVGSSERHTLHSNGQAVAVELSGQVVISAGDYVQAAWAVSDTDLVLSAESATAFAPAADAANLTVTRIRQ